MATRERRLAEFDGEGEPPPDLPVEVLCEDHSGTYQLPFTCRYVEGQWQNFEKGVALEATVIAWRMPRSTSRGRPEQGLNVSECDAGSRSVKVWNAP